MSAILGSGVGIALEKFLCIFTSNRFALQENPQNFLQIFKIHGIYGQDASPNPQTLTWKITTTLRVVPSLRTP